jgi:phosphatidylethanolamine-binding protein (PEBP) family uncharacterized protein
MQQTCIIEATVEPVISFKGTGSYIIACIDPDAPFTSFAFLGPILHWLQSGVKPEGPEDALKAADTPAIARYEVYHPPLPLHKQPAHRCYFPSFLQHIMPGKAVWLSSGRTKINLK